MYSPIIPIRAPEHIVENIISELKNCAPTNFSFELSKKTIEFRPIIMQKLGDKIFDKISTAPPVVIYVFTCDSKQDFTNNIQPNYQKFLTNYSRQYNEIIPIFINDLRRAKGKSFFNQNNTIIQYLQGRIENLQTLNMKTSGKMSKTEIRKIWNNVLTQSIGKSIMKKVELLTVNNIPSIKFLQNQILLSSLFYDLTMIERSSCALKTVEKFIASNNNVFSHFLSKDSLEQSFNVNKDYSSFLENVISQEDPAEFDFYFIVFRQTMQNFLFFNDSNSAINYFFHFIINIFDKMKNSKEISVQLYEIWFAQTLYVLKFYCDKEKENGNKECFDILFSVYDLYLNTLSKAFDLYSNNKEIILNSSAKNYEIITKIFVSEMNYSKELKDSYLNFIESLYSSGYQRYSSIVISKFNKIFKDDRYGVISTLAFAKYGYALQEINKNMLDAIPFDDKVKICCQILSSPNLESSHKSATQLLSDILGSTAFNQKYHLSIPCLIECIETEKEYFVNNSIEVLLQFKCTFKGIIKAPIIEVGFLNVDSNKVEFLTAKNVEISNLNKFKVSGKFSNIGFYSPCCVKIESLNGHFYYTLPNIIPNIKVISSPPPFDFKIELPDILLPKQWQIATIKLNVFSDIKSFQIKVSGVHFKEAQLKSKNKEVYTPSKNFIFNDIKANDYKLNLPILPLYSDMIKVNVISENQNVEHSNLFKISEYLNIKILFRIKTKVAMLTAFQNSSLDILVKNVEFYQKDKIIPRITDIGLPFSLSLSPSSSISILEDTPDYAYVWIKYANLKPFQVKIPVELIEDEKMKTQPLKPQCPFTGTVYI